MNKRIEYIDVAKAIGILLVILGHCCYTAKVPHLGVAIYSFHMPLFFIISGMFIKPLDLKDGLVKYSKAYLKPYFIVGFLMLIVTLLLFLMQRVDCGEFVIDLKRIGFGSGSNEDNALLHDFPTVGPIWFLLALFWGCTISSLIKLHTHFFNSILLTFALFFIGYISAKYIRLPFSLQMGMCTVPFVMIGGLIKRYEIVERVGDLNKGIIVLMVILWLYIVLSTGGDFNMASCRYREGVIRIPLSVIATVFCLYACKKMDFRILCWLKWLGKNTLYVLAGHQLLNFVIKTVEFDFNCLSTILPPPTAIIIEFPLQVAIAIIIGMTIKRMRLF